LPALLAMMTAFAQRSPDSVTILKSDALRKLAQADSLPGVKELLVEKQKDLNNLNDRISTLGETISKLVEKELNTDANIQDLKDQKQIMEEQKKILLDQIAKMNKQLRKEKRKRLWTAIAGTAATVGGLWLGTQL
jgi:chromosome segregation ATPase